MSDDNQQNPLDVLEEILKKNNVPQTGPGSEPEGPTQEEIEAQQLAEVQEQFAERRRQDEEEIRQQLTEMQQIKNMPQYQVRQEQQQQEAAEDAQREAELDGTQIYQLKRKAVQVEE